MLTGFSQAWLGSDHLLVVHSNRFVERYRRFAFSDIQAIVITQGGRRAVWQALVVLLCLFFGLSATSTLGRGFFEIVGSLALLLAILDIARGPRCRCFLQTAVTRECLLCVSRMRTARSFLATLVPAIESVQGTVLAEEFAQTPWAALLTGAPPAPLAEPPAIERPSGYAPEVLFAVLALDSVLVFTALRSAFGVAIGLLPVVYFAEFLLGILALVQSRARNAALTTVLVAAFLCVLIDPFFISGSPFWVSLASGLRAAPPDVLNVLKWTPPIASPKTMLLATGWRAALAATGLLVCYFERTAARK